LLNLVDSSAALRASLDNITFASTDPQAITSRDRTKIAKLLQILVDKGFLTYRAHADEYRLWAGSDVDIASRIQQARDAFVDADVAALLTRSYAPAAVVAGKHSQVTGLLRHFVTIVTDSSNRRVSGALFPGPADGTIVFHLGTHANLPAVESPLPSLIGVTSEIAPVLDAAREVLALDQLLAATDLDATARAEVRERLAAARAHLTTLFAGAYAPDRIDVTWYLRTPDMEQPTDEETDQPTRVAGRSLASLVSAACDAAYPHSPHIRNEMLGRHQLTSQGAKARRQLVAALLANPTAEAADITGHGPERAMYDGVVALLGLHGPTHDQHGVDRYGFAVPAAGTSGHHAMSAILGMLRTATTPTIITELYRRLMAPPNGVKAGVLPLLVLAALMHTRDDVALFEDGTFVPRLSADLVERMVKTPDRIAFRHAPTGHGQRAAILARLSEAMAVPRPTHRSSSLRNASLLQVASTLLDTVRNPTAFACTTRTISTPAQAVRLALSAAFRYPEELSRARPEFAAQARRITSTVLDPTIRGLIEHAQNTELSDDEWIASLAMRVDGQPLANWRDGNLDRFPRRISEVAHTFHRLYSLHFDATHVDANNAFEARRLTLTAPDGREDHGIFEIPTHLAADATALARSIAAQAEERLGPGGARIILAALVQHQLETPPTPTTEPVTGTIDTKSDPRRARRNDS
jgi:hypothetical protein